MTKKERIAFQEELDYLYYAASRSEYPASEEFKTRYNSLSFILRNRFGYDIIKEDGGFKLRKR